MLDLSHMIHFSVALFEGLATYWMGLALLPIPLSCVRKNYRTKNPIVTNDLTNFMIKIKSNLQINVKIQINNLTNLKVCLALP